MAIILIQVKCKFNYLYLWLKEIDEIKELGTNRWMGPILVLVATKFQILGLSVNFEVDLMITDSKEDK